MVHLLALLFLIQSSVILIVATSTSDLDLDLAQTQVQTQVQVHAPHLRRKLVFGGEEAVPDVYTWFVELVATDQNGNFPRRCAGVMISGDTLVTLANCLYDSTGALAHPAASLAWIKRTTSVATQEGIQRRWSILRPHPDHIFPGMQNNVALIKLNGTPLFPEKDVQIINSDPNAPFRNQQVYSMGYGAPPDNINSNPQIYTKLQNATFRVVPEGQARCNTGNGNQFICVDTTGSGKDLCSADEGAALWTRDNTLHGLYAEGGSCSGIGDRDAVFVRTSFFYNFIVATACEISNARCAESCSLLGFAPVAAAFSAVSNFVGGLRVRVVGLIWNGSSSDNSSSDNVGG